MLWGVAPLNAVCVKKGLVYISRGTQCKKNKKNKRRCLMDYVTDNECTSGTLVKLVASMSILKGGTYCSAEIYIIYVYMYIYVVLGFLSSNAM